MRDKERGIYASHKRLEGQLPLWRVEIYVKISVREELNYIVEN